ncbi:hypothetical protein BC629DRAFT_1442807 [Irpex lacteus]|nr:hypothetical protein BC629DRAFT_1442807 [Irpex lacteus]
MFGTVSPPSPVAPSRSRHHLFQEVNISVKRSPKLDVFLAFLDSSPHLSSSIRRLTVHGTVADDKLGYAVWFYVSSETLLNCLDKLPHLAELCLRGIRLTENIGVGGGPTIATSFHHRRPVQRLLLSNVFVHPDRLFHILHFFPRLLSLARRLFIGLWITNRQARMSMLGLAPLPMLESVTLGAESSYQMPVYFFPRLQRSIDITAMRCLTLHFDRLDTCPQITNFMDCAGPQLQTLRIIIGKRARVTAVDSFVDSLNYNDAQRSLNLASRWMPPIRDPRIPARMVASTFSRSQTSE